MTYQLIFDLTVAAMLACCMVYCVKKVQKEPRFTKPVVFFTLMLTAFTLFLAIDGQVEKNTQMQTVYNHIHVMLRDIGVFGSIIFSVRCTFVSYAKKVMLEWKKEEDRQ